jgi:hypothetical protein
MNLKNIYTKFVYASCAAFITLSFVGCGGSGNDSTHRRPRLSGDNHPQHQSQTDRWVDSIASLLHDHAFAFEIDFTQARTKLSTHKASLRNSSDSLDFCRKLNQILKSEFPVSHLFVTPSTTGRASGQDDAIYAEPPYLLKGRVYNPPRLDTEHLSNGQIANILTIQDFSDNYSQPLIDLYLRTISNRSNLIIDIRGNGGGRVVNLNHLLSYFASRNTVTGYDIVKNHYNDFISAGNMLHLSSGSYRNLVEHINRRSSTFSNPWRLSTITDVNQQHRGRIVVLTDRNSASCSDQFAAYMKDECNAKIIGKRTYGALMSATSFSISGGLKLQIPYAECLTTRFERVEGVGVRPHIEVDGNALERAKMYLVAGY